MIGAQGPRMLRLAARYAGIYDTDYHLTADAVAQRMSALDAACAEVGRDPKTIARSAGARLALATELPVDRAWQVGPPRNGVAEYSLDGARFGARYGTQDEIVAHLRAFQAAGVEHVTVNVVDPPGPRGIGRFARVIEHCGADVRTG